MEKIKNTIYKMVLECLESSLPLSIKSSPEKYVELKDIIIPNVKPRESPNFLKRVKW